jgi:hypothetical protein
MILMPKRRQIKPTLLRGPSGGKLLQASFSSSSANNIVRSIPPPPKKVNNIPPPSLSFFAANKTNKTTNLANQFLMLKNVEKEEISLGNEEKKTTITNSQSEIPTKQNSKLPLELAKSLEDNGSTIVSATPLISPTSSSWCVVHKNVSFSFHFA